MADITQRLGFDVSQGVAALRELSRAVESLNISLNRLNGANLNNVSQQLNNLGRSLRQVPGQAQAAGNSLRGVGPTAAQGAGQAAQQVSVLNNQLGETGQQAQRVGAVIRTSFVGFQLLSTAISGLRDVIGLLGEASQASSEFQQTVAEVQTIAGGIGFIQLSERLREISIEFGKPTVQIAEGAYQGFSNQVIQTTSDLGFLETAQRLATASVAETGDAVGVLSSVLNSYELSVNDAARVSDVLFKTVELGRTRLSEFANSLGTVLPLARDAGLSFEEVAAALATITRRGTTTNVALTQIRGIVNKILKPTQLMSQAFQEFGASSGPEAIRAAGGLIPLLQRLDEFAERNSISINQLFGRVRAGAGALNLLQNNGQDAIQTLNELTNSAGSASDAFEIINQTDARQAEIAFNRLRVTVETLGDAITPIITRFVQLFNRAVPDAQALTIVLGGVTASLVVLSGAAVAALAAFIPIGGILAVFAPFAAVILGIAAATTLLVIEQNKRNAAEREFIRLSTVAEEAAVNAASGAVQAQRDQVAEIERATQEATQLIEFAFQDQISAARRSEQEVTSVFRSTLDTFVDSRNRVLQQIQGAISGANNAIANSASRLASAQQQLADINFEESLSRLPEQAQVARTLDRALRTAAESRRQLADAGLSEERERQALETRRRAEQQLADAERRAAATATQADDKQVADARKRFLQDIIQDEQRRSQTVQNLRDQEEARAKRVEDTIKRTVAEMASLRDRAIEVVGTLNDPTISQESEQFRDALLEAEQVAGRVKALLTDREVADLAERVGAGGELQRGDQIAVEAFVDFARNRAQIRENLQAQIGQEPFDAIIRLREIGAAADVELGQRVAEETAAKFQFDLENALARQQVKLDKAILPPDTGTLTGALTAPLQQAESGLAQLISSFTGEVSGAQAAFLQFISQQTQSATTFTEQQVAVAREALQRAQQELQTRVSGDEISQAAAAAIQLDFERGEAILQAREGQLRAQAEAARLAQEGAGDAASRAVDQTTQLSTQMGNTATAAGQVQQSTAAIAGQIQSAVGPATRLANELERAARARGAASGGGAFFGRVIHRQTGGFTRGQDRILTSTAPGEFVINAAAARQFRSELTAINAQQRPQFREQGGATTNIGDVNVNIQTQDASDIQPREIARVLKRELRARTSSF